MITIGKGYVLRIPKWTPPSYNEVKSHWSLQESAKAGVMATMIKYASEVGLPPITPRYRPVRRIRLFTFHHGPMPDPDNLTKIFLDGCKLAKLIVDDKQKWLEWTKPVVSRSGDKMPSTVVLIDDIKRDAQPDYWKLCYSLSDRELFDTLAPAEHPHPRCKCPECTAKYRPDELRPKVVFRSSRLNAG